MWIMGAPFCAACLLLGLAGMPKLRDPMPLVRAVRSVGLPATRTFGLAIAAAEVVIAAAGLIAPGPLTAGAVAAAYLGFSVFVVLALQRGGVLESCGCFGRADTPATRSHVLVTALLAGCAFAFAPVAGPWTSGTPLDLALVVGGGVLIAFLAWQVLAVLPTTTPAAIRSISRPSTHATARRNP